MKYNKFPKNKKILREKKQCFKGIKKERKNLKSFSSQSKRLACWYYNHTKYSKVDADPHISGG